MYLIYLLIIYILELWYSYRKTQSIFSPPVLFTVGFLLCTLGAIMYWNEWDMQYLSMETFLVLSLGVMLFNHTSLHLIKSNVRYINSCEILSLKSPSHSQLNVWIVVQVIFYVLYGLALMSSTHSTDISDAAAAMAMMKDSDEVSITIPRYLELTAFFIDGITYLTYYFFAVEYFKPKKDKSYVNKLAISALVSFLGPLLGGSRGAAVIKIVAFVFITYFIYCKKKGGTNYVVIPKRIKTIALATISTIFISWAAIGALLGREAQDAGNYVMAIYCGAEIKNLDTYIRTEPLASSKDFGHETFFGYHQYINRQKNARFNRREVLDLPYQTYAGYSLGNVYTCFYMFLHDFGYVGVPIMVLIMSVLSSKIWNGLTRNDEIGILCIILYSIISFDLLFCFFSNKVFESMVNIRFIRLLIFWYILLKFYFKKYKVYTSRK